jgi:hypothetical protein
MTFNPSQYRAVILTRMRLIQDKLLEVIRAHQSEVGMTEKLVSDVVQTMEHMDLVPRRRSLGHEILADGVLQTWRQSWELTGSPLAKLTMQCRAWKTSTW